MNHYLGFFTLSLFFIILKANEIDQVKISPDSKLLYVRINDPLKVACYVVSDKDSEKPEWVVPPAAKDVMHQIRQDELPSDMSKMYANITIESIQKKHLGDYTCSFGSSSASFTLLEPKVITTQANFTYKDPSATLSCDMDGVDPSKIEDVVWLKNDTLVSELSEKKRFTEVKENRTLTITTPNREDADLYIARFTLKDSATPFDCAVPYSAQPIVLDFDKSKNLIEDDKMELQCKVKGYPRATVTWMKNDKVLNFTDSSRIILSPLDGYKNARLVIKSVQFDDAGDYTCKAFSSYFNASDSKTLVVRVKDKLAALWPFLGIVGEVVILCTIIFIYEKRRNKQAESQDNNAEDVDGSTTDKKEGLRHRNTSNNPTA